MLGACVLVCLSECIWGCLVCVADALLCMNFCDWYGSMENVLLVRGRDAAPGDENVDAVWDCKLCDFGQTCAVPRNPHGIEQVSLSNA